MDVEIFSELSAIVDELMNNQEHYRQKITKVVEDNIYNIGSAAAACGEYILGRLLESESKEPSTVK